MSEPELIQEVARSPEKVHLEDTVPAAPYALEVVKEEYDGEYLALVATVTAYKEIRQKDPLVRVIPYSQGTPLAASTYRVADYVDSEHRGHKQSKVIKLPLVVPASSMSDYQIELLWGKDAKAAYEEQSTASKAGLSQVSDVVVQQVELLEGGMLYAVIHNSSGQTLQELGVQVAFAKYGGGLDFQKAFQENGVLLELHDLNLKPGGDKKLKIVLEDSPPLQASYSPLIRIVPLQDETLEIYE